tara:strand:- start:348 stop:530 length:183 start_codon:yes stop_codon:yes gene_type:complete
MQVQILLLAFLETYLNKRNKWKGMVTEFPLYGPTKNLTDIFMVIVGIIFLYVIYRIFKKK